MKNSSITPILLLMAALTGAVQGAVAQEKVRTQATVVAVGGTSILDTYLSPETYTGAEVRFLSQSSSQRKGETPAWSGLTMHQAYFEYASPRSDNSDGMAAQYMFNYAYLHNWRLADGRLHLQAGGAAEAGGGFVYNMDNGNNPVQAHAYLNLGPIATATWPFRLFKKSFGLRYELYLPLLGAMFAPNYGQSYYEIFSRGNYDHNIVFTTPASAPSARQMLSVDYRTKKGALRIGYLCDIQQAKVNHLKFHTYSNLLMIGYVRRFSIINQ